MFEKFRDSDKNGVFGLNRGKDVVNFKDERKCKDWFLNFRLILFCFFYALGLNIYFESRRGINKKLQWLIRPFVFVFYVGIMVIQIRLFQKIEIEKEKVKFYVSSFISHWNMLLLWGLILFKKDKISEIIRDIAKLENSSMIKPSNKFANTCVLLCALNTMVMHALQYFLGTEESSRSTRSVSDISNVIPNLYSTSACLYYILGMVYETVSYVFPACFVVLYVILCHDMQAALILHVQKKNINNCSDHSYVTQYFSYYKSVLSVIKAFESLMSLPVFVTYVSYMISLWMSVLFVTHEKDPVTYYLIVRSFLIITAISFAASGVSESDKAARESNLECFEELLETTDVHCLQKIAKYWRLNNAPPYTLSGWGCFAFTKGNYLSAVGYLVTYTLLIMSI